MILAVSGKINSGKDTVGRIIQYLIANNNLPKDMQYLSLEELDNTKDNFSGWEIKKFADTLKDIVCMLIGCTREQLEDQEFKNAELGEEWWVYKIKRASTIGSVVSYKLYSYLDNDLSIEDKEIANSRYLIKTTPRIMLQLLGTEAGRNIIHPNIWVNSLFNKYKYLGNKNIENGDIITANIRKDYPNWIITDMRFPNEMEAIKKRAGITIRVNRPMGGSKFEGTQEEWDKLVERNKQSQHESEKALDNANFDYVIENNGTIEELIEKVREVLIQEKIIQNESI